MRRLSVLKVGGGPRLPGSGYAQLRVILKAPVASSRTLAAPACALMRELCKQRQKAAWAKQ